MPFKSEAQRKYMFAKHPQIAAKWAAEERGSGMANYKAAKKASPKRTATRSGGAVKVETSGGLAKRLVARAGGTKSAAAKKAVKRVAKKK